MNRTIHVVTMAAAMALITAPDSSAKELWAPELQGINVGLAPGASAPPGFYGFVDDFLLSYAQYDNKGNKTGVKLDGNVVTPGLIWSTGLKVLGADYSVSIAQPFDYTNLKIANNAALANNGHWGTFNTIVSPAALSWSLPGDFHVKTGLTVTVDDASSSPAHPPAGHGAGSGNSNWALLPDVAVSWLHNGWNLSADVTYAYNFEDDTTHYASGQFIVTDLTATKTIGKWTFGVGGYTHNQLNRDHGIGAIAAGCSNSGGCETENYGVGPLVGYQFSDFSIMAIYNHKIYARNEFAGDIFNFRLVKPF
ncbi:transporter [Telmatospirillum sp.]|uniref:SphA family protein n=1 Tax=Telmatospirillum sp. TaxID=2079197 RepID=UPI0028496A34|nr:transporter [Telmatospirillum sp.]MDR3438882.1 transporter [Telmatospirillum sp.]